jgi:putative holliday junction resolvase
MLNLLPIARDALATLPQGQRLMGLDLGATTIGIATSDLTLSIASPRLTIARTKFQADAKALLDFAAQEDIGIIVMGLPLNMDGTEGPRCQSTRAFVRNLEKLTSLPIIYWDERLSTVAVTRAMLEADMSRAKRAHNVDKLAAAYILQGLLDMR